MAASNVIFSSVSKRFGDVTAVDGLSLEVDEGEFLVLVGPSGCGKTTALRMVAGLEEPTEGTISIAGVDVTHMQPRDRDIAMVFQSYALYPHMKVSDNLAFGLKQRRTPKQEITARVQEVAKMLEIEHLLERRPKELSGGQRQRVALGRAIARRPKVFLMDEPLSNLDAQLRVHTRGELSALQAILGTTVIYVTHDQVEAMTMGTRIAVMNGGVLQQVDRPQRLYDGPVNTFVATFIGSPAMNLLKGERVAIGESVSFVSGEANLPLPLELAGRGDEREVVLGLRPEGFERSVRPFSGAGIGGPVELIEPLGSDLFVTVSCGGSHVTARLDPNEPVGLGDSVELVPKLEEAHLFSAATGQRIDL